MKLLKTIKDKDLEGGFKVREASRAVVFDNKNLIPLLFVSKLNYHKLPGGGREKGESRMQALVREMEEETGCVIKVLGEIGKVVEYRYKFNLKQTSFCYIGQVLSKGKQKLEKDEIEEGYELKWVTLDEAIGLVQNDKTSDYEGKFIQERDFTVLSEAKRITQKK